MRQASVGIVSTFAVPQCGQVMTDSRIICVPKDAAEIQHTLPSGPLRDGLRFMSRLRSISDFPRICCYVRFILVP
jgi:hypothetical protein